MEKLVYLLCAPPEHAWERSAQAPAASVRPSHAGAALRARLLDETAPALLALSGDAALSRLRVSVVDDAVARGAALHIGARAAPPVALVSFWMEQSQERAAAERVLAKSGARLCAYLVAESRPLVKARAAAPGARAPGFTLVSCITRRAELSRAEFVRIWYEEQRACALETQDTSQYVRNEVVRALTPDAPAWDAIVEETFPTDALDNPQAFYDARDDDARLQRHRQRMIETCQKFLDLTQIESHPMSEYDF